MRTSHSKQYYMHRSTLFGLAFQASKSSLRVNVLYRIEHETLIALLVTYFILVRKRYQVLLANTKSTLSWNTGQNNHGLRLVGTNGRMQSAGGLNCDFRTDRWLGQFGTSLAFQ